jgi:hypothetical protein
MLAASFFVLADVESAARRLAQCKKQAVISPLCLEAVQRIGRLSDIERYINGRCAKRSRTVCGELSIPLVTDIHGWIVEERRKLSGGNEVAKAMDYMLKRWAVFARFLVDGRVSLTNNVAEGGLRGTARGRKSWLFAGSDRGGQRDAVMYSLIVSAKMNDIDPQAWLAHVLDNIVQQPASRLDEMLPWNWRKPDTTIRKAA